jgi:pimeloyl-ACP methyl ester carboxylesterase
MTFRILTYCTCLIVLSFATSLLANEPVDIEFVAKVDGSKQRYVVIEPEGHDLRQPLHVLIALHGHGSDRWQFVRDGRDECRAAREAATRRRMLFVSPDYRAKTSWMGPKAEADLVQIVAELKVRFRIGKVIVCGGSMGGTGALTFATLHPELVDGVVAFNGTANLVEYDRFQDAIAESYGGSKLQIPEEYRRRSAEFHFEKLTMPVATTTGGRDDIVPPESVLRMLKNVESSNPNVLSIHRPEGGHSTDGNDCAAALEFVIGKVLGSR